MSLPNFIIAGAPKSGTTAVFNYLSAHPQVCGSSVKEPAFLITGYTGDVLQDQSAYARYFTYCPKNANAKVYMEASAGYLWHGQIVAPRIAELLGSSCKIMFILRNPIERLYSYFNFQKSRYLLPAHLSFEEYLELCEHPERSKYDIDMESLQALKFGRDVEYLSSYYECHDRQAIYVAFYEDFKANNKIFMCALAEFLDITPDFYLTYQFVRANVTKSAKFQFLHKLALKVNDLLEPYLRQRPLIKQPITRLYQSLNLRATQNAISPHTRAWLQTYYEESFERLEQLIDKPIPWR